MVYTYLGISIVPPPPLDLPRQRQKEHSQRSRPDHRRSHQHCISLLPLTLLRTIQRKSDSAIVSGPSILVDEILHSQTLSLRFKMSAATAVYTSNTKGRPRITYITKHFRRFVLLYLRYSRHALKETIISDQVEKVLRPLLVLKDNGFGYIRDRNNGQTIHSSFKIPTTIFNIPIRPSFTISTYTFF